MIRPCTYADLPLLQPLAEAFLKLGGYGCDWPRVADELGRMIGCGVILACFRDGEAVAALGGIPVVSGFTGQRIAQEMFWYCDPAARGSGLRLLMRFEKHAREQWGCSHLVMASLEASPEAAQAEEIYRRRGYDRLETQFIKEIGA